MEIRKTELKKISRSFRTIASCVINAHFREQNKFLIELVEYVDKTPLIKEYIDSLYEEISDLKEEVIKISQSYGRMALDLSSISEKRINLLYQSFQIIIANNIPAFNLGWFYSDSNKYQDMAKAFGDRLVYMFVTDIERYLNDISTDMGFDNDSLFNINVNSSGVQVNIANNNSTIEAEQTNNWNAEKMDEALVKLEDAISRLEDTDKKEALHSNLNIVKNELTQEKPSFDIIRNSLRSMMAIGTGIAVLPDFLEGLRIIAKLINITI